MYSFSVLYHVAANMEIVFICEKHLSCVTYHYTSLLIITPRTYDTFQTFCLL